MPQLSWKLMHAFSDLRKEPHLSISLSYCEILFMVLSKCSRQFIWSETKSPLLPNANGIIWCPPYKGNVWFNLAQCYLNISLSNCLFLYVCFPLLYVLHALKSHSKIIGIVYSTAVCSYWIYFYLAERDQSLWRKCLVKQLGLVCDMNGGLTICQLIAYNTPHS